MPAPARGEPSVRPCAALSLPFGSRQASSAFSRRRNACWRGLVASTSMVALLAPQWPARAAPQGGGVVSGAATISSSGVVTTIVQSTPKAIINWQSFSVAQGETVNFNQPGASSVTLNRVIGNESSVIAGAINANGQVFLVNSNGILFTGTSQVNAGGLVASTLDIANEDFLAGSYVFSGSSTKSVTNRGALTARDGGYVSLMGKTVSNQGVITATLGTVALTAGSKITLNFEGNSLLDVTIDQGVLDALVENRQLIKADGGKVILSAKAADAVLSAQVNNTGTIQARTMADLTGGAAGSGARTARKGSIKIKATGGTASIRGTLDASAPNGGDGGSIETSGDTVKIDEGAIITTVASRGQTGTWLIDPDGFTIAAAGGDITGSALGRQLAFNNVTIESTDGRGSDGNITVNDKVSWSANTSLTLDATKAIIVNAALTGSGTGSGLVLDAGTDIAINAPSALQVAALTAAAGGDININAPQAWTRPGSWTFNGTDITINDTVDWSAGTLTLNAGAAGGFINLNAVMTASAQAKLVVTYNTGMDTSTKDVEYLDILTGETTTGAQPTSTWGTAYGGINPLFDPEVGTFVGRIDFVNSAAADPLVINGNSYTLITSMAQLASLSTVTRNPDGSVATDPITGEDPPFTVASGYYALATNLDASATTYPGAVIYQLTGTLDGLGHTIDHLTIAPPVVTDAYGNTHIDGELGLIGTIGSITGNTGSTFNATEGVVRNIGLLNVQISSVLPATQYGHDGGFVVGALAAQNRGTIRNAFATGNPDAPVPPGSPFDGQAHADGTQYPAVTAAVAGYGNVGGLVGSNYGLIDSSHADVDVYGVGTYVGGLVGWNQYSSVPSANFYSYGVIRNSYATGTVSAGGNAFDTGGSTGSASIGGFVGYNSGVISDSYTASEVWTLNSISIGGFAGTNNGFYGIPGTLNNVSSSGTVTIGWSAWQGYGEAAGGLVGDNSGVVNGGYTTSNIVAATTYTDFPEYGYGQQNLFQYIGGAFGNQTGTVDNVTANGTVTYNGEQSHTYPSGYVQNYNVFTGGWDYGVTTNQTYNPGAGGTPPQQTAAQAAQQAAAQQAAAAQAAAQAQAQQATAQQQAVAAAAAAAQQARLAAAANAAMVTATTGAQQTAANPPSPKDAKAGTAETEALAGPSVAGHVDARGAPPATTSVREIEEQQRRRLAQQQRPAVPRPRPAGAQQPAGAGGGYGATIRSIDVDGKHFDLERDQAPAAAPATPAPATTAPATSTPAVPAPAAPSGAQ